MADNEKNVPEESKPKMPFDRKDSGSSEGKAFVETVQWEDKFKLRAMTSTFIILVIWIVAWGWLCFKIFKQASEPYFQSTEVVEVADGEEPTEPEEIKLGEYNLLPEAEKAKWSKVYKLKKEYKEDPVNSPKFILKERFDGLTDDAKKAYAEKKSNLAFLGENNLNIYVFLVIAGLPFLLILYRAIYKKVSVSYAVTDYRLIVREGLFVKREYQTRLVLIRDLGVEQGLIQLMMGVGTILVFSGDQDTPELKLEGVRNPIQRKEVIYKIAESKRSEKEFIMGQA